MRTARVKICGITRPEDAHSAAHAGADAIGLVFYPPSSRYLSDLVLAREVALAAGPFTTVVGLFVDAEPEQIESVLAHVPIHVLQFHGSENEEACRRYSRPFIKALRMKAGVDVKAQISEFPSANGILLDTYVSGAPGGTGKVFDWGRVPLDSDKPIIVAGGLDAGNVRQAVLKTAPYGVDVSGGVEDHTAVKNNELMKAFINEAKGEFYE